MSYILTKSCFWSSVWCGLVQFGWSKAQKSKVMLIIRAYLNHSWCSPLLRLQALRLRLSQYKHWGFIFYCWALFLHSTASKKTSEAEFGFLFQNWTVISVVLWFIIVGQLREQEGHASPWSFMLTFQLKIRNRAWFVFWGFLHMILCRDLFRKQSLYNNNIHTHVGIEVNKIQKNKWKKM